MIGQRIAVRIPTAAAVQVKHYMLGGRKRRARIGHRVFVDGIVHVNGHGVAVHSAPAAGHVEAEMHVQTTQATKARGEIIGGTVRHGRLKHRRRQVGGRGVSLEYPGHGDRFTVWIVTLTAVQLHESVLVHHLVGPGIGYRRIGILARHHHDANCVTGGINSRGAKVIHLQEESQAGLGLARFQQGRLE